MFSIQMRGEASRAEGMHPVPIPLSIAIAGAMAILSPGLAYAQNTWRGGVSEDVTDPGNWSLGIPQSEFDDTLINGASPNVPRWTIGAPATPASNWETTGSWQLQSLRIGSGIGEFGTLNVDAYPGQPFAGTRVALGPAIAVGTEGGDGTLNLNLGLEGESGVTLNSISEQALGMAVGVGPGSRGTVNLLGSGKTAQSQNFSSPGSGLLQVMTPSNLVGFNGGTGVVNIEDGAWAITNTSSDYSVPSLSVGVGSGSNGSVNVLAGGKLSVNAYNFQLQPSHLIGGDGGVGAINVQGRNASGYASNAVFGGGLDVGSGPGSSGSLNVLAGGKALNFANSYLYDAATGGLVPPPPNQIGVNGGAGTAFVSGQDAIWYVGGAVQVGAGPDNPITDGTQRGNLHVGVSGLGDLTIAEGGVVTLGAAYLGMVSDGTSSWYDLTGFEDGEGTLFLAETATGTGTLNIGARTGDAPVSPGELRAAQVVFGPGSGLVSFNHVSSDYSFDTPLVGAGTLANHSGTTYLVAAAGTSAGMPSDNSGFSGATELYGGALGLTYDASLGTSSIAVLGSAGLIYSDGVTIANPVSIQAPGILNAQVIGATNATQSGTIAGAGVLAKVGVGTLDLINMNSITGEVRVNDGVLALKGLGSIEQSSRAVVDGTFDVSSTTSPAAIRSLSGTGRVALGNSGLVLTAAADTFAGTIGGAGTFTVQAGSETLTGQSDLFSGNALVEGGELWVSGTLGSGVSSVLVASGARLGGSGTVGGSATVSDSGILSPGAQTAAPGMLLIAGDLVLSPGAILDYDFGEVNVVAGAFNDLLTVGGNLRLDGTINVTRSPGGALLPGLYRVIDYAGVLDDFGLQLGVSPLTGLIVQTSVPGQVNLVLPPPVLLDIWDGDAGPKNNGVVDGGDGKWQSSAGNDNWTNIDATVNAPYADGGFAIFAGYPGTVQVDGSKGAVSASGMQFAVDGYRVVGDPVSMAGSPSVVRVGDGTLEGHSITAVIDAVLEGTTALVKADLGTLVLGADNAYSGGTKVQGGTLQIARDSNLGASNSGLSFEAGTLHTTGNITTARPVDIGVLAVLDVDDGTALTLMGALSGNGDLVKSGGGYLNLQQGGPFSGATRVGEGALVVDGNLGESAVSVASSATLAGHGTVGSTSMDSGSVVAPGNSIGTLTVNGPFLQSAGSTYRVEVNAAGSESDLISVTGEGTLSPGSVLEVAQVSLSPNAPLHNRLGQRYTVLATSGGVTGTYVVTGNVAVTAFTSLVDIYDRNNAYLQVMQTRDIGEVACSPNENAAAGGLQSTAQDNNARMAMLGLPDDAAACDALGQLSGEIYASARTAFLEDSRFLREAVSERLRGSEDAANRSAGTAEGDELGSWIHAFGSWGRFRGNPDVSELDRNIGGMFFGADRAWGDQWRSGVLLGYSKSDFGVKRLHSSGASKDIHLGAYTGWNDGNSSIQVGGAYAWHEVSTTRYVAFPGYADRLSARFNASTLQVFGEVAYRMSSGSLEIQPFLAAAYVEADVGAFSETGGAAALSGRSGKAQAAFSTLGVRAKTNLSADARWYWRVMGGWRHAYGSVDSSAWLSFNTGSPFEVTGVPIERDVLALEFTLEGRLSDNADVGFTYSGQLGDDSKDHGGKAYVSWRF